MSPPEYRIMTIYRQGDVLIQRVRTKAKGRPVAPEYAETLAAHRDELEAWHRDECPDCPWDGHTIFPNPGGAAWPAD